MHDHLTTRELAALLRIKERKVYDLAATGKVPCSKATGKLLFPRAAIEAWLVRHSTGLDAPGNDQPAAALPAIMAGSHDPLLDWALRESQCAIAAYFDGSSDGLERFAGRQSLASALHIYDAHDDSWNSSAVKGKCAQMPCALIEWATRRRGLLVQPALAGKITGFAGLAGHTVAPRQPGAGARQLFDHFLARAGLDSAALEFIAPCRSETDAALAVLEGHCDATFGLEAHAVQFDLAFVPVITERLDLLVDRRAYFEAPMQRLLCFCRSPAFAARAGQLAGYDISGFGRVRYNS